MIGEELAKHLKGTILHLLKSINTSIAIYDFDMEAYGNIVLFESNDNLF